MTAWIIGGWVLVSPAAAVLVGRMIALGDSPPRHRRPPREVMADLRRWGALVGLLVAGVIVLVGGDTLAAWAGVR